MLLAIQAEEHECFDKLNRCPCQGLQRESSACDVLITNDLQRGTRSEIRRSYQGAIDVAEVRRDSGTRLPHVPHRDPMAC